MTMGFASGFVLGFLLWVAVVWWYRRQAAKADKVWMDAIKATRHSTWARELDTSCAAPRHMKKKAKKSR